MIKIRNLIVGIYCCTLLTNPLIGQAQDYIYLFSGEKVSGKKIEYVDPLFGDSYFLIDSFKYDSKKVKFYFNDDKCFANVIDIGNANISKFAFRIDTGKVNVYSFSSVSADIIGNMGVQSGKTIYYNKGFEDLKMVTYKNLVIDLADNPQSMILLDKYKRTKKIQRIGFITGGVLFLGAYFTGIYLLSPPVLICFIGSAIFLEKNKARLFSALEKYNK